MARVKYSGSNKRIRRPATKKALRTYVSKLDKGADPVADEPEDAYQLGEATAAAERRRARERFYQPRRRKRADLVHLVVATLPATPEEIRERTGLLDGHVTGTLSWLAKHRAIVRDGAAWKLRGH